MAVTRINNNQVTDAATGNTIVGINAGTKLQPYSITSTRIANNLTYGSDLTITGNLTVQGTTTNVDTVNTLIQDPLITLADGQTSGTPTVDIGTIGLRGSQLSAVFAWIESAKEFAPILSNTTVSNTTVNINAYANLHMGNATVQGTTSFVGNIVGAVNATGTITGGNLATPGTTSATGNVTGGNLNTGGQVIATSNITGGNVLTGGLISSTGNINSGANIVATANVIGGNVTTGGQVSATGNVTTANAFNGATLSLSGNVTSPLNITGTTTSGNLLTPGLISSTGNISTGANLIVSGYATVIGNVTGGNIVTGGQVTTPSLVGTTGITVSTGSGNINLSPASNIVLNTTYINGLQLTPVQDADAASKYYVDTIATTGITIHQAVYAATISNLAAATGGTVTYAQPNGVANGVGATLTTTGSYTTIDTANVQTVGTRILVKDQANAVQNGVYVYSNATVITRSSDTDQYGADSAESFSINDYFFTTNGNVNAGTAFVVSAPPGVITFGTSNIQFGVFSQSQVYSANTQAGLILNGTVFSAKVDNNTTAFDGGGNISVKAGANLTTPNIGAATGTSLSVTGTVTAASTVGGVITGSTASLTANVTGGNVLTGGLISATGTITTADALNGATLSLSGNVTSSLNVTGNTTSGNLLTAGLISSTGNITGGNLLTGGLISATGNISTGATSNVQTGNLIGGNIVVGGTTGNAINMLNPGGTIQVNGAGANTNFSVSGTGANIFFVNGSTNSASFGSSTQTTNAIVAFNTTTSILIPAGTQTQRPGTGVTGMMRFNSTTNSLEIYNNTDWIGVGSTTFTVITDQQFNGDGVNVAFTLANASTTAATIVSINGVLQIPVSAYAVSGTTLTFTEAPATGDLIDVRALTTTTTLLSLQNVSANASVSVSDTTNIVTITGTANVVGDLTVSGNATILGNVATNQINNGNSAVQIPTTNGNVNIDVGNVNDMGIFTTTSFNLLGNILPQANITYNLGSATQRWKDLYLSNSTIFLGNAQISANATAIVMTNPAGGQTVLAGATTSSSVAGNITGGNIITSGLISAVGNIVTQGNISQPGYIGVGTASPDCELNILANPQTVSYSIGGNSTTSGTDLHISGADGVQTRIVQDSFGTGTYVAFTGRSARGTAATPTQTQSGDTIGQFTGRGFSSGSLQFGNSSTGRVDVVAAENFTDTSRATNVTVFTTASGAITPTAIATFSSASGLSVAGNVTAGNLSVSTGTITVGSIVNANANAVGNIGSSSNYFNTVFAKATSAQYADLAEKYTADAEYAPGTVVIFGGTAEVTVNAVDGDRKVAGVVSTNPSYTMNSGLEAEHVATIALTGRVPCMVVGPVKKGDLMVAAGLGRARAEADPRVGSVIGKALEDFDGAEGTIEVVVGRF